jgi:hypothetical protein
VLTPLGSGEVGSNMIIGDLNRFGRSIAVWSVCRWNACSPGIYDQAVTGWRISLCTECQWDASGRSLCGTRLRAVDDRDVPRM